MISMEVVVETLEEEVAVARSEDSAATLEGVAMSVDLEEAELDPISEVAEETSEEEVEEVEVVVHLLHKVSFTSWKSIFENHLLHLF